MGWTYQYKPHNVKECLMKNWTNENEKYSIKALDCAIKNFKEAYILVEHTDKLTNEKYNFAAVALLHFTKDYKMGTKELDESCGPNEYNCPERILNQLTPTSKLLHQFGDSGVKWAEEWRNRCRQNIEKQKSTKSVKDGDIIVFSSPLKFMNGSYINRFIVRKVGREITFQDANYGVYGSSYKISNWKTRDFKIETKEEK